MKRQKSIIILIILTVFLFGITSTCASDMNDTTIAGEDNMPIESIQNNDLNTDELLTDNPKTFT